MITTKQALDILGLTSAASKQEIKKSWRRMAATHHPDNGGDAEKFNSCKIAYNHLKDVKIKQKCPFCGGCGHIKYKKFGLNFKSNCENCK